jgi:hypothetical protein
LWLVIILINPVEWLWHLYSSEYVANFTGAEKMEEGNQPDVLRQDKVYY